MGRKCCKTNLNNQPTTDRCNISRCQPTALPGKAPQSLQNRTNRTMARFPGPPSATGAGEGNRTLVISLEGFCSTIELHPPGAKTSEAINRRTNTGHNICTAQHPTLSQNTGGGGWIRTNVGVRQQIYSLPPLATRAPLREEPAIMA